jgi:heme oxygenase
MNDLFDLGDVIIFTSDAAVPSSGSLDKTGIARATLRDACAQDHARVDAAFSEFDLSTTAGYGAFLQAQSACVKPIEDLLTDAGIGALIPDWPARRRASLLAADLHALALAEDPAVASPHLVQDSELLGAIYVLEGSRFGGAVLSRRVVAGAPLRFMTASAPPRAWSNLLETLDRNLIGAPEFAMAISAARAVFRCFELAASRTLERVRV